MITFACPQCHKGLQVEDKLAAKKVKCPKCAAAISVPAAERLVTPGPPTRLPVIKPVVTPAKDDIGLATKPATSNQDDGWNPLEPFSTETLAPVPGQMDSMRSQKSQLARSSRAKGPSIAILCIGGVLLLGITVGVTLWATGSLPAVVARQNEVKTMDDQGESALNNKDFDLAVSCFTEAIRLDPKDALAYRKRGVAYGHKGDWDKAIADCTEAIRLSPKDAKAYRNRGWSFLSKGENDKAIVDETEAIRLDPKDADAYQNRGAAYGNKGERDKAIADSTEAIRLNPKDSSAYHNRGLNEVDLRFLEKGIPADARDLNRAISDYSEAIRLNPNDATAYDLRGLAYLNRGELDKAIADGMEAIRLNPKLAPPSGNAPDYCAWGVDSCDKGDFGWAIMYFGEAIRLNPRCAPAYGGRGRAYLYKGENDKAIADCSEAIRLDPDYVDAYQNRGVAYRLKGEKDKAEADSVKAARLRNAGK